MTLMLLLALQALTPSAPEKSIGPPAPTRFHWTDVNSDGLPDALALEHGGTLRLLVGEGGGRFVDATHSAGLDGWVGVHTVVLGDWSGDGQEDLVPSAVGYATATLVGSRILIVGGQTVDSIMGGTVLDIVQVYDITTGLWSTTRPLPAIRTRAACGVIGGSLVVAGGISVMGMPTVDALLLDDGFMQHHYHRKD